MRSGNGSGLLDWNDARIFLAVVRYGSLRAAGRALGISQPTIGRRIAAFEAVFGGPTLFDRLPEGLRLNEAGAALLPVAERLEDAGLSLERHRAATASPLNGTVRISVGEWAAAFLTRHIGSSSENPPPTGIILELVETMQTANLGV
jgi:DNA-binding transcriptional LysR family regulator